MARKRLLAVLVGWLAVPAWAAWQDDIGYTALKAELGAQMPTGAGIGVTQVEGTEVAGQPQYLPDATNGEFAGKTITDKTGTGTASSHATRVGRNFYGSTTGLAPDVQIIDAYEASFWIQQALRFQTTMPPDIEPRLVQNHSWIADFGSNANNVNVLRRLDLVADRDGVVICTGVNNGTASSMPKLLCSAYNNIAVGRIDGAGSYGPTAIETIGRIKPDLVATGDGPQTSYATGAVSGAAAMLLQAHAVLDTLPELPPIHQRRGRALVTKALLMGGATKPTAWRKGTATPSTDGAIPLDYRYGAGTLSVINSYHILAAGRYTATFTMPLESLPVQPMAAAASVPTTGWDYAAIAGGQTQYYFFTIPAGQVATSFSAMLVWNRRISAPPDFDRDDDVDGEDAVAFAECAAGARIRITSPACIEGDLDSDGDVDQDDFGDFQLCFRGPGIVPSTTCRSPLLPSLSNLNLALHAADGGEVGTLLDQSISTLDNIEHIYQVNLPAGAWVLAVTSNRAEAYALTWDARLAPQ